MLGAEDVKKIELETPAVAVQSDLQPKTDIVLPDELTKTKIADIFGLDKMQDLEKYSVEINRVMDYLKDMSALTIDDVVYFTRMLSSKLGNVPGENKIKTVSRYLYLVKERDVLNRSIERLQQ